MSATPLSCKSRRAASATCGSRSTHVTLRARCAAKKLSTPVPPPRSTTCAPFGTSFPMASANADMRRASASIWPW
jgi:hypothetical protein